VATQYRQPKPRKTASKVRRNREAEDISFVVESSSDLINWKPVLLLPSQVTVTQIGGTNNDEIKLRIPMTNDKLFLRLKVE